MHYIIYQIRNILNEKLYIGAHKTTNIDDGYMGSGVGLKRALKKYGENNFEKTILFTFDTENDMYNKETEIVTIEFVRSKNTYNQAIGGRLGNTKGWENWNSLPYDIRFSEIHRRKISDACKGEKNGFYGKTHSDELKARWAEKRKTLCEGEKNGFYGKTHNNETKAKIGKTGWNSKAGKLRRKRISESLKSATRDTIKIFNSDDNLMFKTSSGFRTFCKINDLPHHVLCLSYLNGGVPIYTSNQGRRISPNNLKFKGWYAMRILKDS